MNFLFAFFSQEGCANPSWAFIFWQSCFAIEMVCVYALWTFNPYFDKWIQFEVLLAVSWSLLQRKRVFHTWSTLVKYTMVILQYVCFCTPFCWHVGPLNIERKNCHKTPFFSSSEVLTLSSLIQIFIIKPSFHNSQTICMEPSIIFQFPQFILMWKKILSFTGISKVGCIYI